VHLKTVTRVSKPVIGVSFLKKNLPIFALQEIKTEILENNIKQLTNE